MKKFSWETLWTELTAKLPTLMALLSGLVRDVKGSKPILCLIASVLLKKMNKALALMQTVNSVLLYGYGCNKQVSFCTNLLTQSQDCYLHTCFPILSAAVPMSAVPDVVFISLGNLERN